MSGDISRLRLRAELCQEGLERLEADITRLETWERLGDFDAVDARCLQLARAELPIREARLTGLKAELAALASL